MRRRKVLKAFATVGSGSFAGCSSIPSLSESPPVLGKIEVVNLSFVPNRIRLTVERDSDKLIDQKIGLTAIDAGDGDAWALIKPKWSEQSQYTVRAVHVDESGNRETTDWEYTFSREDYNTYYGDSHKDPGCIGAIVKVGTFTETENGAIGISPTYMENPCSNSE